MIRSECLINFLQGKNIDTVPQHGNGKEPSEIVEVGFSFKSGPFSPSLKNLVQGSEGQSRARFGEKLLISLFQIIFHQWE